MHFIWFKNGESALHGAAMFGHLDIVKMLLRAGADPKVLNRNGKTPSQTAANFEHCHIVDFLKSISTPKSTEV